METVSQRIVSVLKDCTTDVFGVVGNGNVWFVDAVHDSGHLHYTAVRHEAAAVAAADAFYRVSGRLAVATTTYGAGFTNAVTPLAEAVQASVPLVLVAGAGASSHRRPWDVGQADIAAAVGARTIVVGPHDAGARTVEAVELALAERTAVVLAIPHDVGEAVVDEPPLTAAIRTPQVPLPDAGTLAGAAAVLAGAARPAILAGRGAWLSDAGAAAHQLALRLGALTASSVLARGLFPPDDGDLGVAGGFASERSAELLREADVVLALGVSLNQFTTSFGHGFAPDAVVVQVDIQDAATSHLVTHYVRGDARVVAQELVDLVPEREGPLWRDTAGAAGAHRDRPLGEEFAADGRLDPRRLFHELDSVLPADRVVVQDGGHFIGWAPAYLTTTAPNRLRMVGTAYQTIGLGLPSAVGAARAHPGSTTVLITGDGGALMGLADLETVLRTVEHGVIIVVNDAAYGAELHQYLARGAEAEPMLIDDIDFAGLAHAMGGAGATIRSLADLDELRTWLAGSRRGVFVADCRVSTQIVAPFMQEWVAAGGSHATVTD